MKCRQFAASFAVVLALMLGSSCTQVARNEGSQLDNSRGESSQTVSVPEELQQFVDDPRTKYMLNIYAQFPGNEGREMEGGLSTREYDYIEGEWKANVIMQNALEGKVNAGLLILCDGAPVEYTVDGTGETGVFHTFEVEGQTVVKVTFTPNFVSKIGKIDFVQVYDLENTSYRRTLNGYSVFMKLPEEYEAPLSEYEIAKLSASPIPEGETPPINGYGSFLWMNDPDSDYYTGIPESFTYEVKGLGEQKFTFQPGEAGKYRVLFLLDGQPIEIAEGCSIVDCEIKEGEMLTFSVMPEEFVPEGKHGLSAIMTSIDERAYEKLVWGSSSKLILNN